MENMHELVVFPVNEIPKDRRSLAPAASKVNSYWIDQSSSNIVSIKSIPIRANTSQSSTSSMSRCGSIHKLLQKLSIYTQPQSSLAMPRSSIIETDQATRNVLWLVEFQLPKKHDQMSPSTVDATSEDVVGICYILCEIFIVELPESFCILSSRQMRRRTPSR